MRKAIVVIRVLNMVSVFQPYTAAFLNPKLPDNTQQPFKSLSPVVSEVIVAPADADINLIHEWLSGKADEHINMLKSKYVEFQNATFYKDIVDIDI